MPKEKPVVYRCPRCGITSTNPMDALIEYCCINCITKTNNERTLRNE